MEENTYKNIALWRLVFVLPVLGVGVLGYMSIEGYSFLDALYMATITMSTIGFGLIKDLSPEGKLFTVFFIVFHVSVLGYVFYLVANSFFEKSLASLLFPFRQTKLAKSMKGHIIVCGYGRNEQKACETLHQAGEMVVAIESHETPKIFEQLKELKITLIKGNAVEDDILKKAGIERAKAILITLPDDANNVFISLTARELNKNIVIVSRASDESSVLKLHRAGANHVVMPDIIGGAHMASLITKADSMGPMDLLNLEQTENLVLKEVKVLNIKNVFKQLSINQLLSEEKQNMTLLGTKSATDIFQPKPNISAPLKDEYALLFYGRESDWKEFAENFLN